MINLNVQHWKLLNATNLHLIATWKGAFLFKISTNRHYEFSEIDRNADPHDTIKSIKNSKIKGLPIGLEVAGSKKKELLIGVRDYYSRQTLKNWVSLSSIK